jgi:hypothetical protein
VTLVPGVRALREGHAGGVFAGLLCGIGEGQKRATYGRVAQAFDLRWHRQQSGYPRVLRKNLVGTHKQNKMSGLIGSHILVDSSVFEGVPRHNSVHL